MVHYTQHLLDSWAVGQQVDILREMQRLTLSVASKTLFNVEISEQTEELGKAFKTALSRGNDYWIWWNVPFLRWNLPFTPYGQLFRAKARIDRFVSEIIAERRTCSIQKDDWFSYVNSFCVLVSTPSIRYIHCNNWCGML